MSRSKTERETALAALQASADANGGVPVFARVAKELEMPRANLKRWWASKGETATVHRLKVAAKPPPSNQAGSPDVTDDTRAVLGLSQAEWAAYYFEQVSLDVELARATSISALPPLRKLQQAAREEYRVAAARERDVRRMTPAEARARAEQVADQMSPDAAIVMVERFRKRGLA